MFDNLQIIIPSRSRPQNQKTIYNLSRDLWPNIALVVPPEQYNEYRNYVPLSIKILTCDAYGIAPTRQFILTLSETGKVIMADDDLTFYKRSENGERFYQIQGSATEKLIGDMVTYLDQYVIVGLIDKAWSHAQPRIHVECTRFNDIHGYNRNLLPYPHPEFRGMHGEEHDFQLQCITRGLKTVALSEYSKSNRPYAKGGCSDWRTKELMMRELERLSKVWPGIIDLVPDPKHPQGYRFKYHWKEAMRQGGLL